MNKPLVETDLLPESGTTHPSESTAEPPEPAAPEAPAPQAEPSDGVVIGVLAGLHDNGIPLVAFPGNRHPECIEARTTARLKPDDIGRQVALLFEQGDPSRPLVIGCIHSFDELAEQVPKLPTEVTLDGERLILHAGQEIVLRCGKASITLTKAGKIILRGAYLLSRSSGVNRIKGGSVQIN